MSDLTGISSLDVLRATLVNESVLHNGRKRATIDEVDSSPGGVVVYVSGDANPRSPPNSLLSKMFDHGYAYEDWGANGVPDDERAIYKFKPMTHSDGVVVADSATNDS